MTLSPLEFSFQNVSDAYRRATKNSLKHVVSEHPALPGASILTVIETHRVVVYSAPSITATTGNCAALSVHASLTLQTPIDPTPSSSSFAAVDLCWTRFRTDETTTRTRPATDPNLDATTTNSRGDGPPSSHAVLCVLVQSTLYIWNVYPSTFASFSSSSSSASSSTPSSISACSWKDDASWTVALPFDGASIHALPCGLLLCRQSDQDEQHESRVQLSTAEPFDDEEDEPNDEFAHLQAQQHLMLIPTIYTLSHPLEDVVPVMEMVLPEDDHESSATAALPFASSFPIRPNAVMQQRPWLDAGEQVVWVDDGANRSYDSNASDKHSSKPIGAKASVLCVTYHQLQRRHAVWCLQLAPPPIPPLPLHQQLKSRVTNPSATHSTRHSVYHTATTSDETLSGGTAERAQPYLLPFEFEDPSPANHHSYPVGSAGSNAAHTRDEALAEALGVSRRLSPRPSLASAASASHSHHHQQPHPRASIGNTTGAGATVLHHHHQHPSSSSTHNASVDHPFLSPRYSHPYESATPPPSSFFSSPVFPSDPAFGGPTLPLSSSSAATTTKTLTAASGSLSAHWAATCLYHDVPSMIHAVDDHDDDHQQKSDSVARVFTVPYCDSAMPSSSSSAASQLLCLLHQQTLRFFRVVTVVPPPSFSPGLSVVPWPEATLHDCHDAAAVQDWMVVLGGRAEVGGLDQPSKRTARQGSHRRGRRDNEPPKELLWTLHRGPKAIVSGRLPSFDEGDPSLRQESEWRWMDAAHDRVTLCYKGRNRNDDLGSSGENSSYWRVHVSLKPSSSSLAERVLNVIGTSTATREDRDDDYDAVFVATMRADVCRVEQALMEASSEAAISGLGDEPAFAALEAVLMSLIEHELRHSTNERKLSNPEGTKNAWETLLSSDFHQSYLRAHKDDFFLGNPRTSPISSDDLGSFRARRVLDSIGPLSLLSLEKKGDKNRLVPALFEALHFLYEECKLSSSSVHSDLARLARLLRKIVSLAKSNDETRRRFLDYYHDDMSASPSQRAESVSSASTVEMRQITSLSEPLSIFLWVDRAMKGISDGNSLFYQLDSISPACPKLRSIVRIFTQLLSPDGMSIERDLQVIRTLLDEGFNRPRLIQELPPGLALPLLELLYRCRTDPSLPGHPGWSSEALQLIGREDLSRNLASCNSSHNTRVPEAGGSVHDVHDPDNDGLLAMEISSGMLFPQDNRVHEAGRLLRSSRPIFLRVHRPIEASDHDYERLKQKRLAVLGTRTLSLPVGRGMFTIGSLRPVEAERLPIPDLCLKGRVPTTNATLARDESENPSDRVWPEFHNGVAAGLRLPAHGDSGTKITRTWIIYNRPLPSPPPRPSEDETNPIQQRHGHIHAGVLLALGLRGHLASLEMSDIYEYLTQGSVTTTVGVLLGMAANKRGSCDISVSKMLCLHIPSLIPQHFNAIDVASTVQACAVIGCGLLYQKSSHRMMTEFLLNEIGKRPESDANAFDRDSYTLSCGLALGMVNLAIGEKSGDGDRGAGIADLRVEERLYRYMVGGVDHEESRRRREASDRFSLPSMSLMGETDKCCTIYEGDLINTSVTAPAATLALGLMYMKSGNHTIAATLSIPDTHFLLEFVRPDFLGLRLVSKALILWDEVEPSDDWIDRQIPSVVENAYQEMRAIAKRAMEGSTAEKAHNPEYDRRAIRQIHAHLVAGACFGLALRFAGTLDPRARLTIEKRVLELQELRQGTDPVSIASRPDDAILETCLCTASISLALVMAGSGDLDALRLFKALRWRCVDHSRYGHHMMYGMAIGLLFLGGGTCTVGRDPEELAALITSLYPRFPVATSDNEYHLQALRHLYALAVKRQDITAVDIDTEEAVHLSVQVVSRAPLSSPQSFSAPFLLPNSDISIDELHVASRKYYPLKIDLRTRKGGFVFYVKKRSSVLSYSSPSTLQNPLSLSMTSNPFLHSFCKYLVRNSDSPFTFLFLQECIAEDIEEAVPLYLTLVDRPTSAMLWDIRLFRTYYQERHRFVSGHPENKRLLNADLLLPCMHELAERKLLAMDRTSVMRFAATLYGDEQSQT